MRIEQIGWTKNIPERSYERALTQGDVLIAEVTAIMEDSVQLKSQGGNALTARLLGDIGVSVGDFVETVVDEAAGGRYVLRIVDITRGSASNDPNGEPAGQARSTSAQTLLGTLSMLKMNPGTDPKAAAFLARHNLAGTPDNIETLAQLLKGTQPIARLLSEVVIAIRSGTEKADAGAQPPVQAGADAAAQTVQPKTANIAEKTSPVPEQSSAYAPSENAAQGIKTDGAAQTSPGQSARADAQAILPAAQQNTAASASEKPPAAGPGAAAETQAIGQNAADGHVARLSPDAKPLQAAVETPAATVPGSNENVAETKTGMRIPVAKTDTMPGVDGGKNEAASRSVGNNIELFLQKVSALFVRISDRENLAAHIKKAVKELPESLKELKLLVERNDTMNKDLSAQKLEPAQRQLALLSEVKRFDCCHIPLLRSDGTVTTAELYVRRYRNKKAAQDDNEDTVILLGLDTQHMGRVETLVKASGQSLDIRLYLEDMRLSEEIAKAAFGLEETAGRLGYRQVKVGIAELSSQTTLINAEERLATEADNGDGKVDIRI